MAAPRPWQWQLTDVDIEQGERLLAGIHGLSFHTPSPPRTPSPRPLQKLRSRPRVPPPRPASPQQLGDEGSSVQLPLSGRRRGYWSPRWEPLQPACDLNEAWDMIEASVRSAAAPGPCLHHHGVARCRCSQRGT